MCQKARYSDSWIRFKILPLIVISLGFQTMLVVGGTMRF